MAVKINKEVCSGCGTCVDQCHIGAIRVIDGVADLDPDACAECGMCVDACPSEALILT